MKNFLMFVALLIPAPAWGATYYVSTTGNNANSCAAAQNIATPKLTIQAGIGCLAAGDTLQIRQGTYFETIGWHLFTIPSGTAGNIITMMSYPGETASINGTPGLTLADNEVILNFYNTKYWTIKDLKFDGNDSINGVRGGLVIDGISADTGNHHIRLENNEITRTSGNGMLVGAHGTDLINNHFHDIGKGSDSYAVYYTTGFGLIEGNHIHDIARYPIHAYSQIGSLHDNIIRNNVIHDYGINLPAAGILIGGADELVYNNVVYNGQYGIAVQYSGPFNTKVYNNTIYGQSEFGLYVDSDANTTLLRNNILFGNASTIHDAGVGTVQSNNLTTDPDFVNAAGGDFHLLDTSDAIGAGVTVAEVTVDLDGVTRANPPTIGAYEGAGGGGGDPLDPLAENFDAYSTSVSISGLNGGDGWTGAWSLAAGTVTVETAPAWMSGKSLRQNATAYAEAERLFTAHTGAFTLSFKVSLSATPNDFIIVALGDPGANKVNIAFNSSGNLITNTQTLVSGFTVNTAYSVDVDFDTVNQANKFRARVNGGAYTSWENASSSFTSISAIRVYNLATNAHTFWLDDLSGGAADVSCTINVVAPSTHSILFRPNTSNIAWTAPGCSGNVTIETSFNGGTTWLPVIATVAHSSSPYTWDTVIGQGSNVKIRVCAGADCGISGAFTVHGAYVK